MHQEQRELVFTLRNLRVVTQGALNAIAFDVVKELHNGNHQGIAA